MARKTIKGLEGIIAELEVKVKEYMNIINDRNKQIEHMENVANDSFENSTEYKRMNNEIEYLKIVIKGHEISNKEKEVTIKKQSNTIQKLLKDNEELKRNTIQKLKNERGAGRKSRFKNEDIELIKNLRLEGKSYKVIALEMGCSVGLVHKLINENI